ncbi:MAG: hypothetical protein U0573_13125 [Phycisphaerales bacterium]|nr:hypothetical protein [Planctomycetota bacterium]
MNRSLLLASGLALVAGTLSTHAAPWIEMIDPGYYVTDLSFDGSVAAGNIVGDGTYETFRWTALSGPVALGQASVPTIGVGGGSPDISYNGTRVSASILSSDWMLTLGCWDVQSGWTEAFPPAPPFVTVVDQAYGSAWGISGDGKQVVGYYYFNTGASPRVQTCSWSPDTGAIIDHQTSRGRANAASYDGSVVVGWEDSGLGPWIPTAWRGAVKYPLTSYGLGSTQAAAVNADGSVIVGNGPDEYGVMRAATIWRWNGVSYDTEVVGYLPDTVFASGSATFTSVSDDGSVAVGFNFWSLNPGAGGAAIYWSEATGLISGEEYLSMLGLTVPDNIYLLDFESVSPDGSTIAAAGMRTDIGVYQSFLIHLNSPCAADLNHDGIVDDSDFVLFADAYNLLDCQDPAMASYCAADLNRDGVVDDADFVMFADAYNALLCP